MAKRIKKVSYCILDEELLKALKKIQAAREGREQM